MHRFYIWESTKKAKEIELPVKLSDQKSGSGKIIGYTIHIKDDVNKAIMFVDTDDKKRKLITSSDRNIINEMQNTEWVGKRINFSEDQLVWTDTAAFGLLKSAKP